MHAISGAGSSPVAGLGSVSGAAIDGENVAKALAGVPSAAGSARSTGASPAAGSARPTGASPAAGSARSTGTSPTASLRPTGVSPTSSPRAERPPINQSAPVDWVKTIPGLREELKSNLNTPENLSVDDFKELEKKVDEMAKGDSDFKKLEAISISLSLLARENTNITKAFTIRKMDTDREGNIQRFDSEQTDRVTDNAMCLYFEKVALWARQQQNKAQTINVKDLTEIAKETLTDDIHKKYTKGTGSECFLSQKDHYVNKVSQPLNPASALSTPATTRPGAGGPVAKDISAFVSFDKNRDINIPHLQYFLKVKDPERKLVEEFNKMYKYFFKEDGSEETQERVIEEDQAKAANAAYDRFVSELDPPNLKIGFEIYQKLLFSMPDLSRLSVSKQYTRLNEICNNFGEENFGQAKEVLNEFFWIDLDILENAKDQVENEIPFNIKYAEQDTRSRLFQELMDKRCSIGLENNFNQVYINRTFDFHQRFKAFLTAPEGDQLDDILNKIFAYPLDEIPAASSEELASKKTEILSRIKVYASPKLADYVERMSNADGSAWGGFEEAVALSYALNRPIHIYNQGEIGFHNINARNSNDKPILLFRVGNCHYRSGTPLVYVDVRGDGNCFFRAVSHQLSLNEDQHEELRQKACDALGQPCWNQSDFENQNLKGIMNGLFNISVESAEEPGVNPAAAPAAKPAALATRKAKISASAEKMLNSITAAEKNNLNEAMSKFTIRCGSTFCPDSDSSGVWQDPAGTAVNKGLSPKNTGAEGLSRYLYDLPRFDNLSPIKAESGPIKSKQSLFNLNNNHILHTYSPQFSSTTTEKEAITELKEAYKGALVAYLGKYNAGNKPTLHLCCLSAALYGGRLRHSGFNDTSKGGHTDPFLQQIALAKAIATLSPEQRNELPTIDLFFYAEQSSPLGEQAHAVHSYLKDEFPADLTAPAAVPGTAPAAKPGAKPAASAAKTDSLFSIEALKDPTKRQQHIYDLYTTTHQASHTYREWIEKHLSPGRSAKETDTKSAAEAFFSENPAKNLFDKLKDKDLDFKTKIIDGAFIKDSQYFEGANYDNGRRFHGPDHGKGVMKLVNPLINAYFQHASSPSNFLSSTSNVSGISQLDKKSVFRPENLGKIEIAVGLHDIARTSHGIDHNEYLNAPMTYYVLRQYGCSHAEASLYSYATANKDQHQCENFDKHFEALYDSLNKSELNKSELKTLAESLGCKNVDTHKEYLHVYFKLVCRTAGDADGLEIMRVFDFQTQHFAFYQENQALAKQLIQLARQNLSSNRRDHSKTPESALKERTIDGQALDTVLKGVLPMPAYSA